MSHRFGETELIINPSNQIYHLKLTPDDIADTIITVGDPERVPKISQYFDSIEFKQQNREFVTHTGYLNKKHLTVLSTGIGTDNIDIVINEIDALANIDFKTRTIKPRLKSLKIIRIGTTGALQKHIELGSAITTHYALGLDSMLQFYNYPKTSLESAILDKFHLYLNHQYLAYLTKGSDELISLFPHPYGIPMTISAPGFYGPQGRVLRAPLASPNFVKKLSEFSYNEIIPCNFEMESAGIYGLCRILGHQACSISLIVANRITQQFLTEYHSALKNMIEATLEKLTS